MAGKDEADPRWVDSVLEWRWTWLLVRTALGSAYLVGELVKLSDLSRRRPSRRFGPHPGWLWAAPDGER
jgi:hypothetical protein